MNETPPHWLRTFLFSGGWISLVVSRVCAHVLTSCATPVLVLRKAVPDVSLTVVHRILCGAAKLSGRAIHPLTVLPSYAIFITRNSSRAASLNSRSGSTLLASALIRSRSSRTERFGE